VCRYCEPRIDGGIEALIDAAKILEQAKCKLCNEPTPIYAFASHALDYINKQLDAALRGEEGEN
jgi:hypothetical protein